MGVARSGTLVAPCGRSAAFPLPRFSPSLATLGHLPPRGFYVSFSGVRAAIPAPPTAQPTYRHARKAVRSVFVRCRQSRPPCCNPLTTSSLSGAVASVTLRNGFPLSVSAVTPLPAVATQRQTPTATSRSYASPIATSPSFGREKRCRSFGQGLRPIPRSLLPYLCGVGCALRLAANP